MSKTKKIIIAVVCIIIVLAISAYFVYAYTFNANSNTVENSTNNTIEENNITENEVVENEVNEIEENIVENNTTVKTQNEVNTVQNVSTSETTDTELNSEDDKEKALEIVKKDWGSTDGVYFRVQTIDSDGNYVISVNDSETTAALAWYTVNPTTGEFTN